MRSLFVFLVFLLSAETIAATFQKGVESYQQEKYEDAAKIFFDLSEKHPQNSSLLFNLGLSSYQMGRRGLALGLWRKARYLKASDEVSQAIDFVENELGMGHDGDAFFARMESWLARQPLSLWYSLLLGLTLLIGWPLTTNFAKRKLPWAQWSPWIFIACPFWVLLALLSGWQTWNQSLNYGTVAFSDLSTRTSPTLDAPTLSSLDEGSLVQILKVHENWYQIETVDGVPGWVLAEKVISEKGS